MPDLRGKGGMTGVNLVAKIYDNAKTANGKRQFVDVQVDHRDRRADTERKESLNLRNEVVTNKETGEQTRQYGAPYTIEQVEQMDKASVHNSTPLLSKEGEAVGRVLAFKANVGPASGHQGAVVWTNSAEPSDFTIDENIMDQQYAKAAELRQARTAMRDQQRADQPQSDTVQQTAQGQPEAAQVEDPAAELARLRAENAQLRGAAGMAQPEQSAPVQQQSSEPEPAL